MYRKRIIKIAVLVIGAFFLFSCKVKTPSGLTVRDFIDKEAPGIGENIRYEITVTAPKDTEVEFSDLAFDLGKLVSKDKDTPAGGLSVKDSGLIKKDSSSVKKVTQWWTLVSYAAASYRIPKVTIRYREKGGKQWQEAQAEEKDIRIKSLLTKDSTDIRDIKGPYAQWRGWVTYLVLLVLLSAGIAFFTAFNLRKKRLSAVCLSEQLSPWEEAYRRLDELKAKAYEKSGRVKDYYIELSDIVRHYLEGRFNFSAPEMTTEEFLAYIKDSEGLLYEHKNLFKEFLSSCDLVKFAKYGPSEQEIDSSFRLAKKIIDQTKPIDSSLGVKS